MKFNTNIFIKKARIVHGDRYDYSKVEYINMKTKVIIICPVHGIFEQTPDKHIHGKCGCPDCAGNKRLNKDEFITKSVMIHGDMYDYSHVHYVNNRIDVEIICKEHGSFWQSPSNHLAGKGCPFCANNMLLSQSEFIDKAKMIHGDTYDYSHVDYKGGRKPVTIICPIHGQFNQIPYVHLNGSGCPVCGYDNRIVHRDSIAAHQKAMLTCLDRYGVTNPMNDINIRAKHLKVVQSDIVNTKRIQTKRKNQSFNTSLSEYRLGLLLKSVFGEDDVFDNYVSDKYPFKCDYYIKSRHMYIELNAHWSHGGHWYDENQDAKLVDVWTSKSVFYQNAAQTFSVRDVEKRRVACEYRLNYIVFWKTDLSDAKLWFDLGCPDGQDWKKEYSWLQ